MKYLCLVYLDESNVDALSKYADDALVAELLDYCEELRHSGHCIAAHALQRAQMAATIRVVDGMLTIAAGTFAETREQLGGFYLIDARDLNDAIRVASKMPSARLGCIEVRPIRS